jgi:hypothetical protein
MKKVLVVGIVLLSGFIGYTVWKIVLKERLPLLSYKAEVDSIVGFAQQLIEKQRPPSTKREELEQGALELRKRHHVLIERASDADKRRPSYRMTDDIVMQIEYAAQQPESKPVVESRFKKAMEAIDEVKSLLGTDQDKPQSN